MEALLACVTTSCGEINQSILPIDEEAISSKKLHGPNDYFYGGSACISYAVDGGGAVVVPYRSSQTGRTPCKRITATRLTNW